MNVLLVFYTLKHSIDCWEIDNGWLWNLHIIHVSMHSNKDNTSLNINMHIINIKKANPQAIIHIKSMLSIIYLFFEI